MKFLVVAPKNAVKYGNVFPLFMQGRVRAGASKPKACISSSGEDAVPGMLLWLTNLRHGAGLGWSDRYELLGMTCRKNRYGLTTKIYGPEDGPGWNDRNERGVVRMPDGSFVHIYTRVLIRRRKEARLKFIVLGHKSAITYKAVFPLIRDVRVRVGATSINGGRWMIMPDGMDVSSLKARTDASGRVLVNVPGVCWLTNLRHDVRRRLPPLKTMAENLATNKRLRKHLLERYGRLEYPRYDNYAAIEVPFVDAIPSDYDGVMGVPVTFLDKWDPDGGVAIEDANDYRVSDSVPCKPHGLVKDKEAAVDGRPTYCRLLIQPRHELVGITLGNTIEPGPERSYSGAVQHNADGSVQPGGKVNTRAAVRVDGPPDGCWYSADGVDGALLSVYPRLLIRPAGV